MPLTITDEELSRIDLSPGELRLEIAVMLREKDKMTYRAAANFAGVDLGAFLNVLKERGVPWIHIGGTTEEEALEYFRQEHGFLVGEDGRVRLDPTVFPTTPDGRLAPPPTAAAAAKCAEPAAVPGRAAA